MKHYFRVALAGTMLLASCVTLEPDITPVVAKAAAEINAGDPFIEYGTFLYCDEETCWYPEIIKGEAYSVDLAPAAIQEQLGNLVGSVHSHPAQDNILLNEINTTPSDTDWATNYLFSLKSDKPYVIYIIGPDDIMRPYPLPIRE